MMSDAKELYQTYSLLKSQITILFRLGFKIYID